MQQQKQQLEYRVSSPPFDSISSVKFSPTEPNHLLVSAWDATVRFYDVEKNEPRAKFEHRAAVLACCFSDAKHGYSGGLDTSIRELDFETEQVRHLGQHSDSVSCMNYSQQTHSLITGSWDCNLRIWDSRAPSPQQSLHHLPERIYHMDLVDNFLVVGMASRLFHIYDIRKMDVPEQQRESSLKFMTRSVACMVDGKGYVTASTEGRIAVEYFDPSPAAQEKKYAFKCHRAAHGDVDQVWPINDLAFHPIYNTFASAGSDATVSVWDHNLRKRLRQFPGYKNAISAVAFNCNGTKLAIAESYTWDNGEAGARMAEKPALFIRIVGEEMRLKPQGT